MPLELGNKNKRIINEVLIIAAVFLILGSLFFTGCSLVGIAIGHNTKSDEISVYNDYYLDSLQSNSIYIEERDTIYITKTSGDSLAGEFLGYSELTNDEYSSCFIEKFCDSIFFPKLDDIIILKTEDKIPYKFVGFEYEALRLSSLTGEEISVSLDEPFLVMVNGGEIINEDEYEKTVKETGERLSYVSFQTYFDLMDKHGEYGKWAISISNNSEQIRIPFY